MDSIDRQPNLDLQSQLAEHQAIHQQLRITWNVFFAKFGRLRDVQLKVIPAIMTGADVLVTAPTAGGKTEAVMAPVCELIKSERMEGLSCLYVTPTRALVNDLFARLDPQLSQLELRLGRQTADHSQPKDTNVLITTPESLESMLTFKKHLLSNIRIVVMDEIHLLDGTARGDQLRLLLNRLRKYLDWVNNDDKKVTRIAISATVSDPQRIAQVYLGNNAKIVSVVGQRPIECEYISPQDGWDVVDCIVQGMDTFTDVRKVLVFANRRRDVDEYADLFREKCPKQIEIFGHHGSLGRDQREDVEKGFRNAKNALCIATMTLEIGIDIGDVDLVVCIDPPNNLSSFLQRIGRGCRRLQSATRVLCFSSDPISELVFRAYELGAKHGLPQTPLPPLRRSVLLQQMLAYLEQTDRRRRTENQLLEVFCDPGRPAIRPEVVRAVAADMVATGLLTFDEGIYRIARHGSDFVSSSKIFSNLAPKTEVAVVDADSGKTVAYVGSTNSDKIKIAGKRYEIADQQVGGKISVRATDAKGAVSPEYVAKGHFGFSSEVGACLANYLGISSTEIVFIESGCVFTWLAKLHNTVLANCLKASGIHAIPHSFCLKLGQNVEPHSLLSSLKQAAVRVANGHGIGSLTIESLADCMPITRPLVRPPAVSHEVTGLTDRLSLFGRLGSKVPGSS
ncbi:MAG: DEAD/DEAH box helicase [Pirellulaceae bacterium]